MKIKKELIKDRFNIVDYISKYVPLKRSGRNYVGLCPFHHEKTPSFTVNEEKQFFHCFGCSVGGDLVEFLSKYLNLTTIEAVRMLEKESGLILIEGDRDYEKKQQEIKKIIEINKKALAFFVHNLFKTNEGTYCLEYITKRGVKVETIRKFFLGFGGVEWDRLFRFLEKNGFTKQEIEKSGLVVQSSGGYRDFFRNRLVFPIINRYNEIIGFGGRSLDDSLPKYINTPENIVFIKRRNLFGINNAIKNIQKEKKVYIVEGYMDCIMMHQAGFKNTVATLGTAITEEHIKFLRGFVEDFYLIFDGDDAGRKAALRAVEIFLNQGITPYIVLLPEGEDPDSLIRKEDGEKLSIAIENSKKGIDFLIDFYKIKYSLFSTDGLRGFLVNIDKHLQNITNPLEKELIYREVAKTVNLTPEELYNIFQENKKSDKKKEYQQNFLTPEDFVVAFVLNNKDYLREVTGIINVLPDEYREIIEKFSSNSLDSLSENTANLYRKLLLIELPCNGTDNESAFYLNINKVRLKHIKRLKEELNFKILEAEKKGDHDEVSKLSLTKWQLVNEEKEIIKRSKKKL